MWHVIKATTHEINSNILRYYLKAEFALARCNVISISALLLPDNRPLKSTIYIYLLTYSMEQSPP